MFYLNAKALIFLSRNLHLKHEYHSLSLSLEDGTMRWPDNTNLYWPGEKNIFPDQNGACIFIMLFLSILFADFLFLRQKSGVCKPIWMSTLKNEQ